MSRLSGYPLTEVSVTEFVYDGHGEVSGTPSPSTRQVIWQDEVRHVTIGNQTVLIQSWMVDEVKPTKDMVVEKDGRQYTLAGWAEFNQRGLKHYQVFLA